MSVYELGLNEVVIMQDSHASEGNSNITLILTSQSIIQVNKGFWGGDKNSEKHPLLQLKDNNGKPNVIVGKTPKGRARLELYFLGYEKYYAFQGLMATRKWASEIEKAYKACIAVQRKSEKAKRDVGTFFTPLKGALESAKHVITSKTKEPKTMMTKCPRCGAELVGEKGEEIKCSYCDTLIKVK